MSGFEEETYSTIFTSLKHPVRRKILRMLSGKQRNFSEMLDVLGISSSHLTYHLENLGELVSKTENGKYRLSTFGEAAVGTMRKVEEAPKVTEPKLLPSLSVRWKSFFAVLLIGLVVLAGVCYVQYQALNRLPAVENLSVEYYLSTIAPTAISPPISKPEAVYLALEHDGWNETTLKGMEVSATLHYIKFDPGYIEYRGAERVCHGGIEVLHRVTEPVSDCAVSDFSMVRVEMWYGNVTYRYMWVVVVHQAGPARSIPPPGLYYVDAATGEVISYPFWSVFGESNRVYVVSVPEFEIVSIYVSWAYSFSDFESLMESNDLVIVGKVVRSQLDPQAKEIPYTHHEVLVSEVIQDLHGKVETGDTITVRQLGGILSPKENEPILYEVRDSPLMKEGDVSLLFLVDRNEDGIYGGLSPQTRFIVMNGKVYWLGAEYTDRNILISEDLRIDGTELEELTSLLR